MRCRVYSCTVDIYSSYHILTNRSESDMSVRIMYSYLDQGLLTARNIDLKRKVWFKPRKFFKNRIVIIGVFWLLLYAAGYLIGQTIGNFIYNSAAVY